MVDNISETPIFRLQQSPSFESLLAKTSTSCCVEDTSGLLSNSDNDIAIDNSNSNNNSTSLLPTKRNGQYHLKRNNSDSDIIRAVKNMNWTCNLCSYENVNPTKPRCALCGTLRETILSVTSPVVAAAAATTTTTTIPSTIIDTTAGSPSKNNTTTTPPKMVEGSPSQFITPTKTTTPPTTTETATPGVDDNEQPSSPVSGWAIPRVEDIPFVPSTTTTTPSPDNLNVNTSTFASPPQRTISPAISSPTNEDSNTDDNNNSHDDDDYDKNNNSNSNNTNDYFNDEDGSEPDILATFKKTADLISIQLLDLAQSSSSSKGSFDNNNNDSNSPNNDDENNYIDPSPPSQKLYSFGGSTDTAIASNLTKKPSPPSQKLLSFGGSTETAIASNVTKKKYSYSPPAPIPMDVVDEASETTNNDDNINSSIHDNNGEDFSLDDLYTKGKAAATAATTTPTITIASKEITPNKNEDVSLDDLYAKGQTVISPSERGLNKNDSQFTSANFQLQPSIDSGDDDIEEGIIIIEEEEPSSKQNSKNNEENTVICYGYEILKRNLLICICCIILLIIIIIIAAVTAGGGGEPEVVNDRIIKFTPSPTMVPSSKPITNEPTFIPSQSPTIKPTITSSPTITALPTTTPTASPTMIPTNTPTDKPTVSPTESPTKNPTLSPTKVPTKEPTVSPTSSPTKNPTVSPTASPTKQPTSMPTSSPTLSPKVFNFELQKDLKGEVEFGRFGERIVFNNDGTLLAAFLDVKKDPISIFSLSSDNNNNWNLLPSIPFDTPTIEFSGNTAIDISSPNDIPTVAIASMSNFRVVEYRNNKWHSKGQSLIEWINEDNIIETNVMSPSISISTDGSILAAGSVTENGNAIIVRTFQYNNNNNGRWDLLGTPIIRPFTTSAVVPAELSISLSGNGQVIAMSDWITTGVASIQTYKFNFYNNYDWAKIGMTITPLSLGLSAVALSENGSKLAVASPAPGKTRVYELEKNLEEEGGRFVWNQIGNDSMHGSAIDMNHDGTRLIIGQPTKGIVVIQDFNNETKKWITTLTLGNDNNNNNENRYGSSVTISANGNTFAIGAPLDDNNSAELINTGSVQVFSN